MFNLNLLFMKHLKPFFAFLLMLMVSLSALAQNRITGSVVDSTGEPVIGASIIEKGTTNGTITDFDGNFSLSVSSNNAVIEISYIGYKKLELSASDKNIRRIVLSEDSELLDEVVIVGYGAQKKESLTGAVTVVSDKMLKDKGTLSSPAQALQGQVPGVFVTRNSAAPGDESWNMKLRGSFSTNNSDPLIIIDGVESGSFAQLNPSDIESINFLKDASAAIYGSKAAGGVILIQTKKAKEGKTKVEYNGSVTAKFLGLQPSLMSMDQWCNAVTQARTNDGFKSDDTWLKYVALAQANKGHYIDLDHNQNPFGTAFTDVADFVFFDTDWQDILWGNAASTSHELSLSGGNEKSTYRLSGRYMYDDSNLKWGNNNNKRYNFRLSNTFHLSDKMDVESAIFYFRQDQVSPTQVGAALTASTQQPGFPSSTIDGKPYAWGSWGAPNWYCELGGDNKLKVSGIEISETFKYKLNKYFDAVGTVGYNTSTATRDIKSMSIDWYNYAGTRKVRTSPTEEETYYNKSFSRTDLYTVNAYLNWKNTFAEVHNLSAMVGTQYNYKLYDYTIVNAKNILPSLDVINGTGNITLAKPDGKDGPEKWEEAQMSYFSRLNYNYKSKYLLEGNFRYDGSSKFQSGNRWSFFGGVSGGWRISEETFMKNLNVVDELKLRVSYGTVGNQGGIARYDGVQLYNFSQGTGALIGNGKTSYIDTNGRLLSTDRKWEKIKNYNIGLDFGVLNNRLIGTVDLFKKKCDNMLIDVTYPGTLGDKAPTANLGKFKAHGWEGSINWSDKIGQVTYHVGGTFTYATNKLVDNGGDGEIKDGVVSNREGHPLNSVFGLKYCGKIQTEEQLEKYMDKFGGENNTIDMPSMLRLGDHMYEDVNGDGKLTEADFVYLGTDDAKISFSFNGGVEWKGFDLSVIFQGVGKRTVWRDGDNGSNVNWRVPMRAVYMNTTDQSVDNVWSPETPNAHFPTYTNTGQINTYNYRCSSWSVEDGAYLRLKNITLGYTIPPVLLAKTKILSYARVYVSGADLWESTKINDGWDPEASRKVSTYGRYPFTRNLTFGLNLTF